MRIHLIAIGGAVMHNLAIALKNAGHVVSGSDDEIYNPAHDRLKLHSLLPETVGWDASRISEDLDRIIIGMHAHADNPELLKAQSLDLVIQSFPEFIAEFAKDKLRVVVAGSHGKTTTTSMIMHVLSKAGINFDYLVGAALDGFENSVHLSDAEIMVIEGDEYLSSRIDPIPKIWHYKPQIAVITGIAWDHLNVFPTYERYKDSFRQFVQTLELNATLIYFAGSQDLVEIALNSALTSIVPYNALEYDQTEQALLWKGNHYPIAVFGQHNLENLSAALLVCQQLNVEIESFFRHIHSFKGAKKRLELIKANNQQRAFLDYAHSPSKVKATTAAVKRQFGEQKLVVVFELHTYSSLNRAFLPQYKNALDLADVAYLFIDPKALEIKRLDAISDDYILAAFDREDLKIYNNSADLQRTLKANFDNNANYLLMSSGHFAGAELPLLFNELIN